MAGSTSGLASTASATAATAGADAALRVEVFAAFGVAFDALGLDTATVITPH
ncbi:hypothetical protein LMORI2_12140 [Limnohabitans sp. MORI2]|nr:hypothetical protein LMORI2_12140 [Limnohabitans sp. MORI2]